MKAHEVESLFFVLQVVSKEHKRPLGLLFSLCNKYHTWNMSFRLPHKRKMVVKCFLFSVRPPCVPFGREKFHSLQ